MHRRAAFLALLLLLAGCGKRERLNPFDPGNPITGGRPSGFEAIAGNALVRLSWDGASTPDLAGYQLFRQVEGESTYHAITDVLSTRTTSIGDFGLANGVKHSYRLYYVFENGIGALPAEDFATPGPVRAWVADYDRGSLLRMSADGRRVAFEDRSYSGPAGVAADQAGGRVWLTDVAADEVVVYDPSSPDRVIISLPPGSGPTDVALDPVDLTAWVCAPGINQVQHFGPSGAYASPAQLVSLTDPIDAAVDPGDRSLWVCEYTGGRLSHYSQSGTPLGSAAIFAPSRVAVDSATHEAWVTSFSGHQVLRIAASPSPSPLDTISGLRGPIGVAVDARRGRIWVADGLAGQVVALHRDGSVEFRVSSLPQVEEIAVDPSSGEAWCTVQGTGQVARLSAVGARLAAAGGLGRPYAISLGLSAP